MRTLLKTLGVCLSLFFSVSAVAAIGVYDFDEPQQRDLFNRLNEELRCPMCQNQSLADSNAPIARDLRQEVYRLITEEQADEQGVITFMLDRYGDFVLYRPRLDSRTLLLWFGPLLILLMALFALIRIVRNSKQPSDEEPLDDCHQQELDKLLGREK
ncbi:hypothetical protein GZ77_05825 [Endozoicomonas montiporae]|uniref:Cytochrome c-type biogenesis protein n=1 Tax=Endozoicomonas montiporae TaxID=1027273 RepID=A0A081NC21_9GAMM|nr:hypothetical protein GZ77_05825 [Endozoicomonas montiporae]